MKKFSHLYKSFLFNFKHRKNLDEISLNKNNLDELGGIDFKKGCYIGQENTSRIKLRNKLRRRILPIKKYLEKLLKITLLNTKIMK